MTASPLRSDRGRETILLIEDEPALRHLTAKVLRRAGYQVLEATCAREALAHWANGPELIDLVLTDLVLPEGETGRQLAEKLVELKPGLKVVFTSGYSPDFVSPAFLFEEGVNFLRKPCPIAHLLSTIRQRLDKASDAPRAPSDRNRKRLG